MCGVRHGGAAPRLPPGKSGQPKQHDWLVRASSPIWKATEIHVSRHGACSPRGRRAFAKSAAITTTKPCLNKERAETKISPPARSGHGIEMIEGHNDPARRGIALAGARWPHLPIAALVNPANVALAEWRYRWRRARARPAPAVCAWVSPARRSASAARRDSVLTSAARASTRQV